MFHSFSVVDFYDVMILHVRIFVVDFVVKFFLLIFYFSFLFEVFLVLVCLIFEGLYSVVELFL